MRTQHECVKCGSTALLEAAGRVLPQSEESEDAVIGGVLLSDGRAFPEVSGIVEADDFLDPGRREIFRAMLALDLARKPIDVVSVSEALKQAGATEVNHLGGDYLLRVMTTVVAVGNIAYHARTVRERAEARRLGATMIEIANRVYSGQVTHEELFQLAESKWLEMTTSRRRGGGPQGAKKGLRKVIKRIHERYEHRHEGFAATAVPSGLETLDALTCGFKPSQLVVLAARPGTGKSALMVNIAENAADAGVAILVFSLEMDVGETFERIIAANGVNSDHMRSGLMEDRDFIRMEKVASRLAEPERIWVDDAADAGALSLVELRSRARRWRMHEAKGFDRVMVMVDYLQLVHGTRNKHGNREQEVAEVSRGLKALAKELQCPVMALSQLNRGSEARANKRPTMAELRESGQIEQDADIIMFLYRDEMHDPNSKDIGLAEINVAKHRGGPVGMFKARWDAKLTRFQNLSQRDS